MANESVFNVETNPETKKKTASENVAKVNNGTSATKGLLAELFGSFIFIFVILTSAALIPTITGGFAPLHMAVITGVAFYLLYVLFAKVSGGYFNPASTIVALISGKVKGGTAGAYIALQFAGGILAAGLARVILPTSAKYGFSRWAEVMVNGFGDHSYSATLVSQVGIEFALPITVIFEAIAVILISAVVLRVVNSKTANTASHGASIALAYALGTYFTTSLDGAALNPARSLGIAIFAQDYSAATFDWPLTQVGVFVLVPIIVAALTAVVVSLFDDAPKASAPVVSFAAPEVMVSTPKAEDSDVAAAKTPVSAKAAADKPVAKPKAKLTSTSSVDNKSASIDDILSKYEI